MAEIRWCFYCKDPVDETTPSMQCSDCVPDDRGLLELCLQCFSCGVEFGDHNSHHSYKLMFAEEVKQVLLFGNADVWTAGEDDLLLDAIEHHGFGNWNAVCKFVKSKTAQECETHYATYYMDGNIGQATLQIEPALPNIEDSRQLESQSNADLDRPYADVNQSIIGSGGGASPSKEPTKDGVGYMARRDDFDREIDHEAESLISDLFISYDDTPIDSAYKLARVDAYRHRLRLRGAYQRVAKCYGLHRRFTAVGIRAATSARRRTTKEDKKFELELRPFARFTSPQALRKLCNDVQKQVKIMRHIQMLRKFSDQGFKSLTGKLKMHAVQMNGEIGSRGIKRRRKKRHHCR